MTKAATDAPGLLRANLVCMASMLVWATAFPAVEILLPHMPPMALTAVRMVIGFAFLLSLWLAVEGLAPARHAPWMKGAVIGGLGFGVGASALVFAQKTSDPVTVAVIAATSPVIGVALEVLLDNRPLHRWLVLGLLLSVLGGVIAYANGLSGLGFGEGALLTLLSIAAFTVASRLTVTHLSGMTTIGSAAITIGGAALVTATAAIAMQFLGDMPVAWHAIGRLEVVTMLVYGIASLGLSQILWISGVRGLGVGIASMHINAAPFYVMVFMLALGSAWNWWQALGALIVAAAVIVAQRSPPRGAAADQADRAALPEDHATAARMIAPTSTSRT
ncbi:MAG: DMT family transporter [Rhizobiaceae bacterium]|nr:DMT family transporter [Rhizobiaceae bacterium]